MNEVLIINYLVEYLQKVYLILIYYFILLSYLTLKQNISYSFIQLYKTYVFDSNE